MELKKKKKKKTPLAPLLYGCFSCFDGAKIAISYLAPLLQVL